LHSPFGSTGVEIGGTEVDLKLGKNAKFTNKDFLDVLSYIAKTKRQYFN